MGVVYRAFDRDRGIEVALKTLGRMDLHGLTRFKKEFRALADIEHPNLIRLDELFSEAGQWFFTMELVDGTDFLSWVCMDTAQRAETLHTGVSPFAPTLPSLAR